MSRPRSPTSSSSEDDEADQGPGAARAEAVPVKQGVAEEDSDNNIVSSPQPPKPLPLQKRRRVTRACDECRRKKIKCDGKQPCTHCTVYSYECTYDQPSNRRRNPAPQYVEALESRLQRAETVLRTVLPDVDLDDPDLSNTVMQRMDLSRKEAKSPEERRTSEPSTLVPQPSEQKREHESLLESMVENTGSLDLDDRGHWDFHGHSSGVVFLRRMREQFGDQVGHSEGYGLHILKNRHLDLAFESPQSGGDSPSDSLLPNFDDLPGQEHVRRLCEHALNDACAIFPFVHKPTFYQSLNRVYDTPPENFGIEEHQFLPLMYATMALGCLFAKAEQSPLQQQGYSGAIDQGFQWLKSSRRLMEITDCRDLTSLQTILLMIMFLQSTARLSACYSHIGIAVTSSLRLGLHRSVPVAFNPIEREVRKRIFWTVRKMDIYVGALLGLPEMLSDDNIDQEMPLEADDEFITLDRVLPMPSERIPVMAAFNAHTRLVNILAKTVKYIYPIKGLAQGHNKSRQSYVVNHAQIREIEQDLLEWMERLPMALRPGGDSPPEMARIQQNLRMVYAHLQMFLYRPFLHYASSKLQSTTVDPRSYACAAACVSVSRNIIHITGEMRRRGLLISWFYMYTTFFAILTLVFFVLENPSGATSADVLRDAYEGKGILTSLAKWSMPADRCTMTLTSLFEQLSERLKEAGIPIPSLKKRQMVQSKTNRKPTEPSSRPTHQPNARMQSQQFLLAQTPSSQPEYHPSAFHGLSAFSPEVITNDYQNSNSNNFFRPVVLPTLQRPDYRADLNTAQPHLTSTQNSVGTGFAGLSAMMFPSADPFAYPKQPMSSIERDNPIKLEDNRITGWYDTRSPTVDEPAVPVTQALGAYPPYLFPSQHPSAGAGAQDMRLPIGMDHQGFNNHLTAPTEGVESRWTGHQTPSGHRQGMNIDHIVTADWNPAWMHPGYGP